MTARPSRRLDRDTAERLLRGVGSACRAPSGRGSRTTRCDGADLLAGLLAAAAAPARPGELAGERATLLAFRAARLAVADEPDR